MQVSFNDLNDGYLVVAKYPNESGKITTIRLNNISVIQIAVIWVAF